jgi:hypothetical protein
LSYECREPTEHELKLFLEFLILPKLEWAKAVFIDGAMVALAGILPDPGYRDTILEEEARTIAFLEVHGEVGRAAGLDIVRRLRGVLRELGRTVYIQHDEELPNSGKLLAVLGFEPTNEIRPDLRRTGKKLRVWRWQC